MEFILNCFIPILATFITSYLIGAVNSSLVVTKILNIDKDIRNLGSGNAGFTNALRTVGKKVAILAFIGDFTKGVIAVWIGIKIASMVYVPGNSFLILKFFAYTASLGCILGHIYPCFFKFKGGKGILTAWASSLLIDFRVFFIIISVFLIVFLLSKIISLASIFAAISYPISTFLVCFFSKCSGEEILISTLFTFIMAAVVLAKHKSNIIRILNGTEKKITIGKVNN